MGIFNGKKEEDNYMSGIYILNEYYIIRGSEEDRGWLFAFWIVGGLV